MNVPADLPAHSRRTTPELQGNGTNATPGTQRSAIVIRSDSEGNWAEITAGLCREIGAYFLISGRQNDRVSRAASECRNYG